jgi:hypothetical protein
MEALLSTYDDISEEDEEKDAVVHLSKKARQSPPEEAPVSLPPPLDLLPDPVLVERDTHKGRIRSFPHIEGSYPTHVYIQGAAV